MESDEELVIGFGVNVDDLGFSVRTSNCLYVAAILTLPQLLSKTEQDLLRLKNFGRESLSEVKAILSSAGYRLKESDYSTERQARIKKLTIKKLMAESKIERLRLDIIKCNSEINLLKESNGGK